MASLAFIIKDVEVLSMCVSKQSTLCVLSKISFTLSKKTLNLCLLMVHFFYRHSYSYFYRHFFYCSRLSKSFLKNDTFQNYFTMLILTIWFWNNFDYVWNLHSLWFLYPMQFQDFCYFVVPFMEVHFL